MSDAPTPANLAGRLGADAQVDMDDVDADIEADVEAALGQLEALPDLAVTDHVAVFEGVQQRLSEILSNVDDANLRLASVAVSANLRLASVAVSANSRLASIAVSANSRLASIAVSAD
ncbi:hypothetical protein [Glycomyces arizonensis]|uniref:hypothetical protein n=1 Tax=Glycomyces arizonensis TaxID=256035 RepID=UPI00041F08D4|nr:hypothetical protein [Glycomyces arizonensis]